MENFAPGILAHNLARQPRRLAHIITYSTAKLVPHRPDALDAYEQALRETVMQPTITFDVRHFPVTPVELAVQFSGVSRPVQEYIEGFGERVRDM